MWETGGSPGRPPGRPTPKGNAVPLRTHTRRSAALAAAVAALALGMSPTVPARAEDPAAGTRVDIQAELRADGSLAVHQVLDFADKAPATLTQQLPTRREADPDGTYYPMQVSGIKATNGASTPASLGTSTSQQDETTTVSIETGGARSVALDYVVTGATHRAAEVAGEPARTEFSWNFLQGLSVPVQEVTGEVRAPGTISYVTCQSGPAQRLSPCTTFGGGTHDAPQPSFTDGPRAAGDVVELTFAVPADVVAATAELDHRWSLDRAFSANRTTLLASLLPLLLGGGLLWLLHRRTGADRGDGRIVPVAHFTPVGDGQSRFTVVDEVRPGHLGTVADERVDPVDVTATLLDLAVRGWLRIVELPRERAHQPLDWTFERLEGGSGELRGFEARLRDAVCPPGAAGVHVAAIDKAVAPVVEQVQHELYDDVVAHGWFERSPEHTRNRWTTLGWIALAVAIVATIALVALTTFGLVGFALTALALGLLLVGQEMPRRTAKGSVLLNGLQALAVTLQTQPTHQLPHGQELAEVSRVLPYAVVLGGRERWIQALVDADDDPTPDGDELDWYRAPGDWHLRDLPDSLESFIVTVQGKLFGR